MAVFKFWTDLACRDETEQVVVAEKMVSRVTDGDWPGLATSLEQALQKPEECKGLAALPEHLKTKIKATAKNETKTHQKL